MCLGSRDALSIVCHLRLFLWGLLQPTPDDPSGPVWPGGFRYVNLIFVTLYLLPHHVTPLTCDLFDYVFCFVDRESPGYSDVCSCLRVTLLFDIPSEHVLQAPDFRGLVASRVQGRSLLPGNLLRVLPRESLSDRLGTSTEKGDKALLFLPAPPAESRGNRVQETQASAAQPSKLNVVVIGTVTEEEEEVYKYV